MIREIEIYESKRLAFESPTVIDGFPGVGLVSTIAANYIVGMLGLEQIGSIASDGFPAVSVIKSSVPSYPVRIYGREDLVVFVSEFNPRDELTRPIANTIIQWAMEKESKMIISGEGMALHPQKEVGEEELRVYGIGSTANMNRMLEELGIETFRQGIISGVSGMLLNEGERLGFPVLCILAEAHPNFPDARAAAKLVEAIDAVVPEFEIDTEPLYVEAEQIEQSIRDSLQQLEAQIKKREKGPSTPYMFG